MKTAPQKLWNYIHSKQPQACYLSPEEKCTQAALLNNHFKSVFSTDDNIDPPIDAILPGSEEMDKLVITNLLKIKAKIIENIENKLYTVGIFLDFKRALNSIKHEILLKKFYKYGIRGCPLNLINSYLTNHYQYTQINGITSYLGKCQ